MGSNPTSPTAPVWLALALCVSFAQQGCADPASANAATDTANGSDSADTSEPLDASPFDGAADDVVLAPVCPAPVSSREVLAPTTADAADVTVTLSGATSLLLTARCPGGSVAIDGLTSPDGRQLIEPGWSATASGCPSCGVRTAVRRHRVAVLVPSAWRQGDPVDAARPLQDGDWRVRVARISGDCALSLEATTRAGFWPRARLSLRLRVPNEEAVGIAEAAVASAAALLAPTGLELVTDGPTEVTPLEAAAVEDVAGAEALLPTSPGIELRLVPALHDAAQVAYAGVAPTPAPLSGGVVALSIEALAAAPALAGRTLAHELGHALGLYHTSEVDQPSIQDPIDDTLLAAANNLMTPTSDGVRLSDGQRTVLFGHPALELICAPAGQP